MEPTFQNGDVLLLKRWGEPKKDDIIIAYIEELDCIVVKRILAAKGDFVSIEESGVYVNGKKIGKTVHQEQIGAKFQICENEYFLMGDNMENSLDSRSFGCVGESAVRGIVIKKLF